MESEKGFKFATQYQICQTFEDTRLLKNRERVVLCITFYSQVLLSRVLLLRVIL